MIARPGFTLKAVNGVLVGNDDRPPDPDTICLGVTAASTTYDLDCQDGTDLIITHIMTGTPTGYVTCSELLADGTVVLYHGEGYCQANSANGNIPTLAGNMSASYQVLFEKVPAKVRLTLYRAAGTHSLYGEAIFHV